MIYPRKPLKEKIRSKIGWGILVLLSGYMFYAFCIHLNDYPPFLFYLAIVGSIIGVRFILKQIDESKENKDDNDPYDVNKKAFAKQVSDAFRESTCFNNENGVIILDLREPAPTAITKEPPVYGFICIDPAMFLSNAKEYTNHYSGHWQKLEPEYYTTAKKEEKIADYIVDALKTDYIVNEPEAEFCCFRPALKYILGNISSADYSISSGYGSSSTYTVTSGSTHSYYFNDIIICRKSFYDKVKHKIGYDSEEQSKLYDKYVRHGGEKLELEKSKRESRQNLF